MEKEDKQLLLQDLTARLLYGIKVLYNDEICTIDTISSDGQSLLKNEYGIEFPNIEDSLFVDLENIKPYLRPMDSMTDEEVTELAYKVFQQPDIDIVRRWVFENKLYPSIDGNPVIVIDWLNKRHFDFRGLIEKGLALEVTEENNPYKD